MAQGLPALKMWRQKYEGKSRLGGSSILHTAVVLERFLRRRIGGTEGTVI